VSKLTTDIVTYCTEASNQKSKYATGKYCFTKKSTVYDDDMRSVLSPTLVSNGAVTDGVTIFFPQKMMTFFKPSSPLPPSSAFQLIK